MLSKKESRAVILREVLGELNVQLTQSECIDVLSKIGQSPNWITHTSELSKDQQIAEQYLDELIEGVLEVSYAKFTRRYEEKYLVNFPEAEFRKEMRYTGEDLGAYIGREYLGCLSGMKRAGDDRYPDHVRYIWRCFFEKNEELIRVGIYRIGGTHYVCQAGSV